MICKTCGANMPDGSKFCSNCGSILSVEPAAPAAPAEPDFDATIIADADVPAAPVAPVYQAPAAPVTPEPPVYKAPAAPVQPAYQVPVASAAPAGSDFDATVIADADVPAAPVAPDTPAAPVPPAYQAPVAPVAPVTPAAPVYQAPVTPPAAPAAPVYQAPVAPAYQQAAAAPKKKLDTKMIAIIGGAAFIVIALIVGILFATGVFDGKSKDGKDEPKGDSVSADVKDYFKEELEYYDCEVSGFKSECKVKGDGAYYQLISADMEHEDEKGYLLCYVIVCGDEIIEGDWMDFEDEESFNEVLKEMKDDAEENEEEYIEELNEFAEEYAE